MIITISSTYECIIVLIDLKQLLTHNNQKQKDKSSHLGFGVFFSDRRVVPYLLSYHCYRAVKVILKVMPITEPGQAFRAPLRPITLVT